MAKEPTGASPVARFGIIGNVTAPISSGSFAQLSATDNRTGGNLIIVPQANTVLRYPGASGTEVTLLSAFLQVNLGDADPTQVYVRSAGAATTVGAWYS
jgi:hypothetical protein